MEGPDIYALLTASQAAKYAGVSTQAIIIWRRRGHLQIEGYDAHGKPLYTLLGVAKAEHATRRRARR